MHICLGGIDIFRIRSRFLSIFSYHMQTCKALCGVFVAASGSRGKVCIEGRPDFGGRWPSGEAGRWPKKQQKKKLRTLAVPCALASSATGEKCEPEGDREASAACTCAWIIGARFKLASCTCRTRKLQDFEGHLAANSHQRIPPRALVRA